MALNKPLHHAGWEMLRRAQRKLSRGIDMNCYRAKVAVKRFTKGFKSGLRIPVHNAPPTGLKRLEVLKKIQELAPWYQTIDFGHGIIAHATDKGGRKYSLYDAERGIAKWDRLIYPNLPIPLRGARILEIGSNAGLNLIESIRNGAAEAIGLEQSPQYVAQAQFVKETFSMLDDVPYPIHVFRAAMEDFDYRLIGNFDIVFCFSVIYHIGPGIDGQWEHEKYKSVTEAQAFQLQCDFLKRMSKHCRYIVFQAYADTDRGRGSGRESLLKLTQSVGLQLVSERTYRHRRGYIQVVQSPSYSAVRDFPVSRVINKFFLSAGRSAERELLELYLNKPSDFELADLSSTRYWKLRTGRMDEGALPERVPKIWWVVPWAYLPKKTGTIDDRKKGFRDLIRKFTRLADSILRDGYNVEPSPIPGFVLIHPERGEVFRCLDGNHRVAVLSYLDSREKALTIPVKVWQEIHRDDLLEYPITRELLRIGLFSESEVFEWFDKAFETVV